MESFSKKDFDRVVKLNDLEVFTGQQLNNYIKESNEAIIKSEGEKEILMKEVVDEIKSFTPVIVWDTDKNNQLCKSIQFVRRSQIEWDAPNDNLEKSRGGTYKNTPENIKLGRVGQRYGAEKAESGEEESKRLEKEDNEKRSKRGEEEHSERWLADKKKNDEKDSKEGESGEGKKDQFKAGDTVVDSEGTEWEVRIVTDKGYKLRGIENEDSKGFITFNEAEEFDFIRGED